GQEIYGPVLYDPWIGKVTNQPPVLSWLGVGGYQSDGVDPSVSFTGSAPAFKVVYTDPDNDAPALLKVFIDAASYDMVADSGQDGDFKNGEVYYFTPPLDALIKGLRQYHFETSDGTVSTRLPAQGELVFEVRNIPVILIPGILGTEMKRGDELLWMDLSQMLFSTNDDFLDPLQMNSDGLPSDSLVSASDVVRFKDIPGPFNYDYFDGLVKEFISKGYIEDDDIFVFPYDWRLDIRVIAQSLNNKIIQVLSQSGSLKVDLVAHSMGGLVAKQYIIDNPESKIDKLIFIGTPHLGAPKALKALLFGDTFGVPLILNQLEMKKLAQNMLSVYQLLPSKEYFNRIGSYYYDLSSTNQNEHKVLTFLETKALLVNRDYNILGIESADSLHTEAYDNLNLSTYGVDSYNISGCKSPTITGIVQLNKPNFVGSLLGETEYMLYMGAGDETVPLGSSTGVNVSYANSYYYKSAEHSKMPSQESIRNLVTQIVTGKINNSDLPTDVIQDSTQCKLKGKLVSVHSPVELHVYDAQGNHVGPAENNSIEEGIGGVTYEEVDGNKFVFLSGDTSQSYTVKLQATGNGSFNMRVKDIVDDAVGNTIYYNQVPITSSSKAELAINSVVTGDLLLDSAGNGNLEVIQPSAILDATQSQDLVKPTTTISLSGTSGTNGWFKSQVAISLTAIDDNAGVLRTEYSLDSGQTWVTYNDPFNVTSEGKITILYRSIDRAGNIEEFKSQEVKIDAIPPEANIVFDQQIKDIVITGIDALSSVSVTEVDNITTLVDEAGNTTELRFSEKNRRRSLSASLLSIKYNGVELSTAKRNKFNYVWVYNKQGVLRELIQSITFNNDFVISAVYNSKRNVTMIMGKDVEKKKTREIYKGLKLINIVTDKGKISYNIN
ncbi:MAG: hypothetical protein HY973_04540, partial [Candidatus Kerfeldbacteria bacterium]|nr:hypothetical protein [Candidatus Kerfeldbacteria bacterium]